MKRPLQSTASCADPTSMMRRSMLTLAGAAALTSAMPAWSRGYPNKPIRFVVPYAPGGGTDLLIRTLQNNLAQALGQTILVDNKSGAAGALGAREVARSAPDGYTFLVSNNGPSVVVPLLQKDAGYDPIKDFTPVTTLARAPIVLIANPSVPAKNAAEFIEWARKQPQAVAYASAGVGSIGHLSGEFFAQQAQIEFLHVPYRGQAPTITAVLAGETPAAFTSSSDMLLAHVAEGKIQLIGVGSAEPSPLVPGAEPIGAVLPDYRADFWQGVLAPANTPEEIVKRVGDEITRLLATPEIRDRYAGMSYAAASSTPTEFADMIVKEVAASKALIAERNITAAL